MNLLPVAAIEQPTDRPLTRQAIEAKDRSAPLKVTGRLKVALDAMVWLGLKRREAAEHANMKEHSLYVAFTRPHVKAYYLTQLEVLRTSERARNIHRLTEIRDAANNMPAVNAIKMLEQLDDEEAQGRRPQAPFQGLVVVINQHAADEPSSPKQVQVIENTGGE